MNAEETQGRGKCPGPCALPGESLTLPKLGAECWVGRTTALTQKSRSSVFIVGFSPCASLIWRSHEQIVASLNYQKEASIWFFFGKLDLWNMFPWMLTVASPGLICSFSQLLHFTQWLGDSFAPLSSYLGSPFFSTCPFSTDGSKDLADHTAMSQLYVYGFPMLSYSSASPDSCFSGFCCGFLHAVVFPRWGTKALDLLNLLTLLLSSVSEKLLTYLEKLWQRTHSTKSGP